MDKSEQQPPIVSTHVAPLDALHEDDNELLASLGYKSEFRREFSVSIFSDRNVLHLSSYS